MNSLTPSQALMRKYREMGFERHHILEAWVGSQDNENIFRENLLRIQSRDQFCSEQRLAWDGKRADIKRIVNQTKLKKLSTKSYLENWVYLEFMELRKKGLLLKKEYKGSRGLNLEFFGELRNEDIKRVAREMKGYLRRVRDLSVKFDYLSQPVLGIVPFFKSMKRNFVGLVSLKLSLKSYLKSVFEDLYDLERLFTWLRPTLKHLDLEFAENDRSDINLPKILRGIIMKTLQKLETLSLNFRNLRLPMSTARFLINTACPQMINLKTLSLQMGNCWVGLKSYFPQASAPSNLQCLKLDFDKCIGMDCGYLTTLQSDILIACPVLKELYIRLPNYIYQRFPGRFLSALKEEFLQKLNLKRLAVELSHELEDTWQSYQDVLAIDKAEEVRIEELTRNIQQKAGGEDEFRLYCETLLEEDKEDLSEGLDEQEEAMCLLVEERMWDEYHEIEEQQEAERILRGGLTEGEWTAINIMREIEYEMSPFLEYDEQEDLLDQLEREQKERARNEIKKQEEAERILDLEFEEREVLNEMDEMQDWSKEEMPSE